MFRIALVAHHVAPICAPFAGGVESLTWYLARWLAQRGHDVVLYAPPGSDAPGVEVRELDLSPSLSDAARTDVSMPPAAFMAAHHAYQRLMLELAEDAPFDVVHSHSLHYLPVAMAPMVGVPMLLTLHTPPTPWLESALRSVPPRTLTVTAVSETTRRLWSGIADVTDVIVNGVDLGAWPAGPGGEEAVWWGRIVPEKAPHLAIDAAHLAGLPLRLAGPVCDRAYFAAEVEPRLGPGVAYAGHLDHRELATWVGSSRVAVVTPSWPEPFGLVAAEAMACGTPVAGFRRGGLVDLVAPAAGRLSAPGDVDELARAMREAAALDRAAVRAHAERALCIDAMGRGYESLYAGVAAPRRLQAA